MSTQLEWNGTLCGIVTPYAPEAEGHDENGRYHEGDSEPCVECESDVEHACLAYLRRVGSGDTLDDVQRRVAGGVP
jgi:hypothetical protein